MPRPRTLLFAFLAIIGIILFARSTSSSDKTFYDKTVEGLHLKQQEGHQQKMGSLAAQDRKLREAAKQVEVEVKEAAEERRKKGGDDDETAPHKHGSQKIMGGVDADAKEGKPHEVGTSRGKWTTDAEDAEMDPETKKPEQTEQDRKMDAILEDILKRSPIIIFSKSYCPFSKKAKAVFAHYKITPAPFIVEIDHHELGSELQDKLLEMTGRRTVPNVLINGKSIGGGDDVEELHNKGDLLSKIQKMGGKRIVEAHLRS